MGVYDTTLKKNIWGVLRSRVTRKNQYNKVCLILFQANHTYRTPPAAAALSMSDIDFDFGGVSGVSGVAQGNDERQPRLQSY